jgi:rhodanese-related sulfurtransferase
VEIIVRFASIPYVAVALLFASLASGAAKAADTPPALSGAKVVSAEQVAAALAAGTPVIDSRVASEFADSHIKGAVNIPYREKSEKTLAFDSSQDQFNLAKLPPNKQAALVIYCNGPECWKSFKASTAAIKAGYTNINWYRAGFPDWKSKGLPTE